MGADAAAALLAGAGAAERLYQRAQQGCRWLEALLYQRVAALWARRLLVARLPNADLAAGRALTPQALAALRAQAAAAEGGAADMARTVGAEWAAAAWATLEDRLTLEARLEAQRPPSASRTRCVQGPDQSAD